MKTYNVYYSDYLYDKKITNKQRNEIKKFVKDFIESRKEEIKVIYNSKKGGQGAGIRKGHMPSEVTNLYFTAYLMAFGEMISDQVIPNKDNLLKCGIDILVKQTVHGCSFKRMHECGVSYATEILNKIRRTQNQNWNKQTIEDAYYERVISENTGHHLRRGDLECTGIPGDGALLKAIRNRYAGSFTALYKKFPEFRLPLDGRILLSMDQHVCLSRYEVVLANILTYKKISFKTNVPIENSKKSNDFIIDDILPNNGILMVEIGGYCNPDYVKNIRMKIDDFLSRPDPDGRPKKALYIDMSQLSSARIDVWVAQFRKAFHRVGVELTLPKHVKMRDLIVRSHLNWDIVKQEIKRIQINNDIDYMPTEQMFRTSPTFLNCYLLNHFGGHDNVAKELGLQTRMEKFGTGKPLKWNEEAFACAVKDLSLEKGFIPNSTYLRNFGLTRAYRRHKDNYLVLQQELARELDLPIMITVNKFMNV